MIVLDTPLWSLTIVVDQNHKKKIEKNLTNAAKFSIMYIESERGVLVLSLWMNIDDSSQLSQQPFNKKE